MRRPAILSAIMLCAGPAATAAEPTAARYMVQVDVIEGGVAVFSPRIVMAAGSAASATTSAEYAVKATLSPINLPHAGRLAAHVVVMKSVSGRWTPIAVSDLDLAADTAASMTTDPVMVAGSPSSVAVRVVRAAG